MAQGIINFTQDGRTGYVGFNNVPDEVLEKVLMILIDHKAVTINSDGNISTNFYPNRRKEVRRKHKFENYAKCHYQYLKK